MERDPPNDEDRVTVVDDHGLLHDRAGRFAPKDHLEADLVLDDPQTGSAVASRAWMRRHRHHEYLRPPLTSGDHIGGLEVGTDDISMFTLGGCALWATAAHHRTGWPVVRLGATECLCGRSDPDSPAPCDCQLDHFMVQAPDGMVWDVRGEHDPEGLVEGHVPLHDVEGDAGVVIEPVEDDVLVEVLDRWHPDPSTCDVDWATWSVSQML